MTTPDVILLKLQLTALRNRALASLAAAKARRSTLAIESAERRLRDATHALMKAGG